MYISLLCRLKAMLLKDLNAATIHCIFESSPQIQSEIVDDDMCLVMKDAISSVWVDLKKSVLKFSSYISARNCTKQEIDELVSFLNRNLPQLKVTYDEYTNPDGSNDLTLSADKFINPSEEFNFSYIHFLHHCFEELVTEAALSYREKSISKNYRFKQLELELSPN